MTPPRIRPGETAECRTLAAAGRTQLAARRSACAACGRHVAPKQLDGRWRCARCRTQ